MAADLLDSLMSNQPADDRSTKSKDNLRQSVEESSSVNREDSESPYPRDRSSSAPNINIIKDDFTFNELQTLQITSNSLHSGSQQYSSK